MNVLVACEESQTVCKALRERGHRAFSCDIQECSGGHPEWHIQGDVIPLLNGNCSFTTADTHTHTQAGKWDMILAFPPCTHLAVSGAWCFAKKREDGRQREGIEFFCKFLEADCDKVVIENPVNIISGNYVTKWFPDLAERYHLPRKPSQSVSPHMFGDPVRKKTNLWIKGLPNLVPTNIVDFDVHDSKGKSKGYSGEAWFVRDENGKILSWNDPRTAKARSKTYPGLGREMANQWAGDNT